MGQLTEQAKVCLAAASSHIHTLVGYDRENKDFAIPYTHSTIPYYGNTTYEGPLHEFPEGRYGLTSEGTAKAALAAQITHDEYLKCMGGAPTFVPDIRPPAPKKR